MTLVTTRLTKVPAHDLVCPICETLYQLEDRVLFNKERRRVCCLSCSSIDGEPTELRACRSADEKLTYQLRSMTLEKIRESDQRCESCSETLRYGDDVFRLTHRARLGGAATDALTSTERVFGASHVSVKTAIICGTCGEKAINAGYAVGAQVKMR